jgi:hypothetical protein
MNEYTTLQKKTDKAIREYCKNHNEHYVCFFCAKDCKAKYEKFDDKLQAKEFCAQFDDLLFY